MKFPLRTNEHRAQDILRVIQWMGKLPENEQYEVYCRQWRPGSLNQQGYYRVCTRYIAEQAREMEARGQLEEDYCGWDEEDFHRFIKDQFGIKSTTELETTQEWHLFLDHMQQLIANTAGICVPEPE